MTNSCSVSGCARPRYARQPECEAHYRRRRRTGDVDAARSIGARPEPRPCMVETCDNRATERGLCHGHYLRLIRAGNVQAERPLEVSNARGLCSTHRTRVRKFGDVLADEPVRTVSGNGYLSHGYRYVPVPAELRHLASGETPAAEHRLVMAQMLGRALRADESVHHRNGDRLCNEPSNLELWSRLQPSGQRVADKIRHALDLIEAYVPELLADGNRGDADRPEN